VSERVRGHARQQFITHHCESEAAMSVTHPTQSSDTIASTPVRRGVPVARVIAGSLVAGIAAALVLTLVVFPGAAESVITGSILSAFGLGWAMMAVLSVRFTAQPQRWTAVPAVFMGVSGVGLVVCSPQNAALTDLNWVWPPATFALVVWMFVQTHRNLRGKGRWLLTPVLVVLAATTVGATVENVAEVRIHQSYPAPGTLNNVGGHRLHIYCKGDGGPTVVLFNGLGEISATWARITDEVSSTARVCAYDRAGQGWSDDTSSPQDGVAAAGDLHALLTAAGEHGPYVLVGHSTGGPYALTYAAQYPQQVAGMVLLDSSSPEQMRSIPSYAGQYALALRRGLAFLPTLTRIGLGSLFSSGAGLPADAIGRAQAMTSTARAARNGRDEISMIPTVFRQAQALTSLHSRPLVVLTTSDSLGTDGWKAAQDTLAALSENHLHRDVESTHAGLITDERPAAESAHAIAEVIASVRTGSPLR
jgi:pimeloyl-ACP methyl ester carboxylesterase